MKRLPIAMLVTLPGAAGALRIAQAMLESARRIRQIGVPGGALRRPPRADQRGAARAH